MRPAPFKCSGQYLRMVRGETQMPNFNDSSSATRSSPQVTFSRTMRAISWRRSLGSVGHPAISSANTCHSPKLRTALFQDFELAAIAGGAACQFERAASREASAPIWRAWRRIGKGWRQQVGLEAKTRSEIALASSLHASLPDSLHAVVARRPHRDSPSYMASQDEI